MTKGEVVEAGPLRELLRGQMGSAWALLEHHLGDLEDEECFWRPAGDVGLHVAYDGRTWLADWPERETYDVGPASIAWLTWHIGFWWSMALDHSFGDQTLRREAVTWPGSARGAAEWLSDLHERWAGALGGLSDAELGSSERVRWPFADRPFSRLAAWVNLELMKNAAEIGYCRYLYAMRSESERN